MEDEGAAVAGLLEQHGALRSILGARLSHLQVVGGFWARGDVRGACAALQRASGDSIRGRAVSSGQTPREAAAQVAKGGRGGGGRRGMMYMCCLAAALASDVGSTPSAAATAGCQASPQTSWCREPPTHNSRSCIWNWLSVWYTCELHRSVSGDSSLRRLTSRICVHSVTCKPNQTASACVWYAYCVSDQSHSV